MTPGPPMVYIKELTLHPKLRICIVSLKNSYYFVPVNVFLAYLVQYWAFLKSVSCVGELMHVCIFQNGEIDVKRLISILIQPMPTWKKTQRCSPAGMNFIIKYSMFSSYLCYSCLFSDFKFYV